MDILKYKGYEGTAELDMSRGVCRGKLLLVNDLVTYESATPRELQAEFEAAVEDYIATCKELDREAQVPLKGQFNVRVSPLVHKDLVLRAAQDNITLNETVARACAAYLCHDVNHNHSHTHIVSIADEGSMVTLVASDNDKFEWRTEATHVCH
jgi:predicted HicB family RNase H-like nuclease